MAIKNSIASGLAISALLALGFAAVINTGLMAGQIPGSLYGVAGHPKGCVTKLDQKANPTPEISLAQFHSDQNPNVIDGSAGGYCYNPPTLPKRF